MTKLKYGAQGQVSFRNVHEYYFALGFLANTKNAELCWENNEEQGAWGSEGRILCHVPEKEFPQFFRFTAGRGNIYARINCNEYVGTLITEHHFNYNGRVQNITKILETIPEEFRGDFQSGYGGTIESFPEYKKSTIESGRKRTKTNNADTSDLTLKSSIAEVKKPEPLELYVGEIVFHGSFGKGSIHELNDVRHITVHFDTVGLKKFQNPEAFIKGYLVRELVQ